MRVVIFGGTGTIGSKVAEAFTEMGDEVIIADRSCEVQVDLKNPASIIGMFEKIGHVDAVIAAMGAAPFVPIEQATADDFESGLHGKLLAQINAAVYSLPYLSDGGSITLMTGILTQHPVSGSLIATTANAGLEGFVKAAVPSLPRGIRINAVSPTMLEEAKESYGPSFIGFQAVPGSKVAQGYVRSAYGVESGQIFQIWN